MNNYLLATIGILLIASGVFVWTYDVQEEGLAETNYIGLVKLGLAPNSPPRNHVEGDIDTGIVFKIDNNYYRMYESRSFGKLDFGKTFIEGES